MRTWWLVLGLAGAIAADASAQVLVRVGDPSRATYSEMHEALRDSTPAADSVLAVMRERSAGVLWGLVRRSLSGAVPWNDAPLALTRLAELRDRVYADSAARLARQIEAGQVHGPPARDPSDLLPPLHAVALERARAVRGEAAVLKELLAKVPTREYDVGDAWVLGRIPGSADSIQTRFLAASDTELKVRWLTLLTFSADTSAVPLLARVYAAPDSFGVPARYGSRASDALLWIGTRRSLEALLAARDSARARGAYADPALDRGGYDFLANDSSAVISRTGKWLLEWVRELPTR
jgi:hypothetical protein